MPRLLRLVIGTAQAHYRLVAAALTGATAGLAVAFGLRRVGRVEVAGDSMRPTLEPGDRLLVVRRGRQARPGDLVTVPDPRERGRVVVKRVAATGEGRVTLRGDNPVASTDSRTFGPVPATSVEGRVVYRYLPEERRGRPH
jgi:nickel-type superoxide dismutase maturation protease